DVGDERLAYVRSDNGNNDADHLTILEYIDVDGTMARNGNEGCSGAHSTAGSEMGREDLQQQLVQDDVLVQTLFRLQYERSLSDRQWQHCDACEGGLPSTGTNQRYVRSGLPFFSMCGVASTVGATTNRFAIGPSAVSEIVSEVVEVVCGALRELIAFPPAANHYYICSYSETKRKQLPSSGYANLISHPMAKRQAYIEDYEGPHGLLVTAVEKKIAAEMADTGPFGIMFDG
ncbi:hypothetical protein JG687_00013614, partial [Phytophthora cactorum]